MTYLPAFDPYGAAYRLLHLIALFPLGEAVEVDRLRIFDFYLLFPERTHMIHLRRTESQFRAQRARAVGPRSASYSLVADGRRLLERMQPCQTAALQGLSARGIISPHRLLGGEVCVVDVPLMQQALSSLPPLTEREDAVAQWLVHGFGSTPMTGNYGLKYRTQLIEYRYDGC